MTKIKYTVKENTKTGTHSFYAKPVTNGTLTTDELIEEACTGLSIEPSIAKAAITQYIQAVQRNVLKGFRCNIGDDFVTLYPNIKCSVKDVTDKTTGAVTVATASMVKAQNAVSRLGATVAVKFSKLFAQEVSWQKVDQTGAAVEDEDINDDDDTEGTTDPNAPEGGIS